MKNIRDYFFFFCFFANVYSANNFTVTDTRNLVSRSVSQAQQEFIERLTNQQGLHKYSDKSYQIDLGTHKAIANIENNRLKISFLYDEYIHATLELPNLSNMINNKNEIDEIMKKVINSKDYLNYSARRNIDSMTVKLEKNSITVILSNGNPEEGTIFSIDFKN